MTTLLENYYLKQPEPIQGCLLALKSIILGVNGHITHERKYQIPFFYYKGKKLCFLWVTRKKLLIGFVEDRTLQELVPGIRRKDRMETMQLDPDADIPIDIILENLDRLIRLYDLSV